MIGIMIFFVLTLLITTVKSHQPFFVEDVLRAPIAIPNPISRSRVWYIDTDCMTTDSNKPRPPFTLVFNATAGDKIYFSAGQPTTAIPTKFTADLSLNIKGGESSSLGPKKSYDSDSQTPTFMYEPYSRTDNIIRLTVDDAVIPTTGEYTLVVTPSNPLSYFFVTFGTDEGGEDTSSLNLVELLLRTLPKITEFYKKICM